MTTFRTKQITKIGCWNITTLRLIEEEIRGKNKTWREVKAIATQRERWKSFTYALCSKRNDRN